MHLGSSDRRFVPLTAMVLLCLFCGCGFLRTARLLKAGEVSPPAFTSTVPFEERLGLMVIKVRIHGVDHDFMLDSGAPNAISKELAMSLGLMPRSAQKVTDSQGNEGNLDFVVVDSMDIGDAVFLNTGAVVVDLRATPELACLGVSGLIGANLMRKAIWDINAEEKRITMVSDRDRLVIPSDAANIPFRTAITGTPFIDARFNGRKQSGLLVDLGSNGGLYMDHRVYEGLLKDNRLGATVRGVGVSAVGLYGSGASDSLVMTQVRDVAFDGEGSRTMVVSVKAEDRGRSTMGMALFNHYRTILDWGQKTMTLVPQSPHKKGYEGFGFSPAYRDSGLVVGSILNGSRALASGLELGDRIVEWNGVDRTALTREDWCLVLEGYRAEGMDTVRFTVRRGEEHLPFVLGKEVFIAE